MDRGGFRMDTSAMGMDRGTMGMEHGRGSVGRGSRPFRAQGMGGTHGGRSSGGPPAKMMRIDDSRLFCYMYSYLFFCILFRILCSFSALTLLVGRQEGHPACKYLEWCGAGMVVCLERGADLHTAQLMPLPLTVSCFGKIEIGFILLLLVHPGSPEKGPLNVCVCVCYFIY